MTSLANAGQLVIPRAGTLRNFFVFNGNPGGASNVCTYTLLLNGVATAIVLTLNVTTVAAASDLVSTLAVAQGDRLGMQIAQGTPAVVAPRTIWSCEYL